MIVMFVRLGFRNQIFSLTQHKAPYTGNKPYKCDVLGTGFLSKFAYILSRKISSPPCQQFWGKKCILKLSEYNVCMKGFKMNNNMAKNMRERKPENVNLMNDDIREHILWINFDYDVRNKESCQFSNKAIQSGDQVKGF